MRQFFTLLLFLLPCWLFAQVSVTGKVIAKEGREAIAGASVFLSNTGIGSASTNDGEFKLGNVGNGQYELVITFLGYEPFRKEIMVTGNAINLAPIELMPKTNMLKAVRIGVDNNRAEHLRVFINEFLGPGANSKKCKVLNPEVIDFSYSKRLGVLKASSEDFIVIENRALGYTIKYLLNSFTLSRNREKLFIGGSAAFEPLKGTPEEEAEWEQKRLQAFNGSSMHFLRSSLHNLLIDENFTVKNTDGKKLTEQELLRRTDKDGVYALTAPKELVIRYGKKASRETELEFNEKYVFFDFNGVILNPESNTMKGFWGGQRIAELLPVDYRRPEDVY